MDVALQNAAYACRACVHTTLGQSPGAIVFQRDMLLNIPLVADLQMMQQHRQAVVDRNLLAANARRVDHDWRIGDQVYLVADDGAKLAPKLTGPYDIVLVHANGNCTIRRAPTVLERVNIRRLCPYLA